MHRVLAAHGDMARWPFPRAPARTDWLAREKGRVLQVETETSSSAVHSKECVNVVTGKMSGERGNAGRKAGSRDREREERGESETHMSVP